MAKAVQLKDKNGNKVFAAPWMPIGSIFLSINNTNPSNYFGGTWEALPQDYYLITAPITQTNIGKGGSWYTNDTVLTVDQMPSHNHTTSVIFSWGAGSGYGMSWTNGDYQGPYDNGLGAIITKNTGGGKGHNHFHQPPYYQVYAWKRIK